MASLKRGTDRLWLSLPVFTSVSIKYNAGRQLCSMWLLRKRVADKNYLLCFINEVPRIRSA